MLHAAFIRTQPSHAARRRLHLQPAARGEAGEVACEVGESDGKVSWLEGRHTSAVRRRRMNPDTSLSAFSHEFCLFHRTNPTAAHIRILLPRGAVPTGFHRALLSTLPPKKLLMVLAGR